MLFDILRMGSMDSAERIQLLMNICARVFVIFCVLPIHEYAHALTAHKLGDDTARLKGRMTIAPMAHIDPIGALMIFLLGFGYAKPVPVNMRNFKNPKAGMAIVALAGPLSNLVMAILFLILRWVFSVYGTSDFTLILAYFFYYAAYINVSLAVFNLLPIPPLDGSRIATALIPNETYYKIMQYERYIMIGLFVLLLTGILTRPLGLLTDVVIDGLEKLTSLPFVR